MGKAAGVKPKSLLACYPPVLTEINEMKGVLASQIPPDERFAAAMYKFFCAQWPARVDKVKRS